MLKPLYLITILVNHDDFCYPYYYIVDCDNSEEAFKRAKRLSKKISLSSERELGEILIERISLTAADALFTHKIV